MPQIRAKGVWSGCPNFFPIPRFPATLCVSLVFSPPPKVRKKKNKCLGAWEEEMQ